jgi:hypothetical protein
MVNQAEVRILAGFSGIHGEIIDNLPEISSNLAIIARSGLNSSRKCRNSPDLSGGFPNQKFCYRFLTTSRHSEGQWPTAWWKAPLNEKVEP